jgi:hypothetical protein
MGRTLSENFAREETVTDMDDAAVRDDKRLSAARDIFAHLAENLDAPFSVRLWDGSTVPVTPVLYCFLQNRLA